MPQNGFFWKRWASPRSKGSYVKGTHPHHGSHSRHQPSLLPYHTESQQQSPSSPPLCPRRPITPPALISLSMSANSSKPRPKRYAAMSAYSRPPTRKAGGLEIGPDTADGAGNATTSSPSQSESTPHHTPLKAPPPEPETPGSGESKGELEENGFRSTLPLLHFYQKFKL
jgi:hypothetical protein